MWVPSHAPPSDRRGVYRARALRGAQERAVLRQPLQRLEAAHRLGQTREPVAAQVERDELRELRKRRRKLGEQIAGEVELQKIVHKRQESDFKDEFCLILLSLPLLILAYSVFFGDPALQERVDYFFEKFENLPFWYQGLVIGAFSTILGIRGVSAIKKK